jgi:hypothetical protein
MVLRVVAQFAINLCPSRRNWDKVSPGTEVAKVPRQVVGETNVMLATDPKAPCCEVVTSSINNTRQGGEAHGEDGRELHIDSFGVVD